MFVVFRRSSSILCSLVVIVMMVVGSVGPGYGSVAAQDETSFTKSFPAAADAYVTVDAPTVNFGLDPWLHADEDGRQESWLRFDVRGISGRVERATLRLWVTDPTDDAPALWFSPNNTWTETGLSWNTRPAIDALVANHAAVEAETWLEYDVTNAVRHSGTYTFALIPEDDDGIDIRSRESGEHPPQLVVESTLLPPGSMDDDVPILLAAGDISTCDWDEDEYTARILDSQPGTIAALGDNVQRAGAMDEFTDCYDPTWGRHKDRTMPTPGNHEYYTDKGAPYFAYFGEAAGVAGEGYYSYTLGDWHVIVLNSNIDMDAGSPQGLWLREELASRPATCTLAYWHHSRFSSSTGHGGSKKVQPLWDTLYEYGADVVLSGHEHIYERFAPQNPEGKGDPDYGIRQFTVSTGGAVQRTIGAVQHHSEVRSNTAHGVLRLKLYPDAYEWQFLAIEGDVFSDSGRDECHGAPQEAQPDASATPEAMIPRPNGVDVVGRRWDA